MGTVSVLSELTTAKSTPAAPVVVSFVPFDALESRCVAMKGNFKFQRGELGLGYYLVSCCIVAIGHYLVNCCVLE